MFFIPESNLKVYMTLDCTVFMQFNLSFEIAVIALRIFNRGHSESAYAQYPLILTPSPFYASVRFGGTLSPDRTYFYVINPPPKYLKLFLISLCLKAKKVNT